MPGQLSLDLSGVACLVRRELLEVQAGLARDPADMLGVELHRSGHQGAMEGQVLSLSIRGQGCVRGDGRGLAEDRPVLEDDLDLLVVGQKLLKGRGRRLADRALVVGEDDDRDVWIGGPRARRAGIFQHRPHDGRQRELLCFAREVLEDGGRRQAG